MLIREPKLPRISALFVVVALAACTSAPAGTDSGPPDAPVATSDDGGPPDSGPPPLDAPVTADSGPADGGVAPVYAAVIRGTLASSDRDMARAMHDAIAMGGEASARAAGDFAHDVLRGVAILDGVDGEFLAIDRWTDAAAMQAFYADPAVAAAFGSLFASPPTIEYFEAAPTWVQWGTMESGDAFDPYYWHFALGTLASTDEEESHMAHDAVAAGGRDPSMAAGNVAHVVFLGLTDRRRFLAVDIWNDDANIMAFYSNPMFRMFFLPLFESVSEPVYESTEWYQW
jgi:quinol monooxygenase YgiN